jgi:hypothetical protein
MHDEKIWGLDIYQDKYLLTGGGDSNLRLWQDCTVEKEQEEKQTALTRLQDEQRLSALIREQDYLEAALMAFRLNKLRDFYLVISKILKGSPSTDPVDSVLEDRRRFKLFKEQAS